MIYEALAYAVVHCHLSPREFARLTPEEWEAIASMQIKHTNQIHRTSWEQTRSVMYAAILPHLQQRLHAQELFPLPWDEDTPTEKCSENNLLSEEELLEIQQRYQ